jgi:hypothetical protein
MGKALIFLWKIHSQKVLGEYTLVALVGGEKQEMQPEERISRWKDAFPH